jgi:hypothetical protein
LAAIALALLAYEVRGFSGVHALFADFRPFWCAGSAALHGADPYTAAALSHCERAPVAPVFYSAPGGVVVPAPLPPYAFVLFAFFAAFSYPVAACIWIVASAAAILFAVRLLVKTLSVELRIAACLFALPAIVLWLPFGEATPIALLGAALAAWALQAKQWAMAALGCALLAVEPHLALGGWICVALFVPRMRVPLAITAAALLGMSMTVGPHALIEYVFRVLPVHALAEVPRPAQYSATWILYTLGAPAAVALRIGALLFVCSLCAGIAIAVQLARRWSEPFPFVFSPVAAAAIGGTFIHASQIVFALPLAAAIACRERGELRQGAAIACGLLAVPWQQCATQMPIALTGIAVAALAVLMLTGDRGLVRKTIAGAVLLVALLVAAHDRAAVQPPRAGSFPVAAWANGLASASWGRYIWREQATVTAADWLGKAPAWIALLLLAGCAVRTAAYKEPEALIGINELPAVP